MNDTWTNNNEVMAWGFEDWQEALVALSTNRIQSWTCQEAFGDNLFWSNFFGHFSFLLRMPGNHSDILWKGFEG